MTVISHIAGQVTSVDHPPFQFKHQITNYGMASGVVGRRWRSRRRWRRRGRTWRRSLARHTERVATGVTATATATSRVTAEVAYGGPRIAFFRGHG